MLLDSAMSILSRLAKIAAIIVIDIMIGLMSGPQAEKAGHSVADGVPSAVDLVLGIFAWKAFWVAAFVSSKGVGVDQGLLQSSSSCFNDFDWPALSASNPGLFLLFLHPLLQL